MNSRASYSDLAQDAMKAMYRLAHYGDNSTIEPTLRLLVELRVSQINGCAYCCDLHSEEARKIGESQQRLDLVAAWKHAPFFTDRERAAFEWAEQITLLAQSGIPDDLYEQTLQYFSEQELVDLTIIISTMNTWNRLAVGFRTMPKRRTEVTTTVSNN